MSKITREIKVKSITKYIFIILLRSDLKTNKVLEEKLNVVCEEIKNNHDIGALVKEKEEFKAKHLFEWKTNSQTHIVLESPKRLITSPSFILSTKSKTDFPSKLRSSTSENKFFVNQSGISSLNLKLYNNFGICNFRNMSFVGMFQSSCQKNILILIKIKKMFRWYSKIWS